MKDSYTTFLSRSVRVQDSVKQYSEKIAYFLQVSNLMTKDLYNL